MPHWVATEEDRIEALRRFLSGLAAGQNALGLADDVAELTRERNTWPGEVYMALAADALEVAEASRERPIRYEGLLSKHLPECKFRGRQNRKIQYGILTSAAVRGGLEPDLLDEVTWWDPLDYWEYALYAAVAIIRASADRLGMAVDSFARRLAERHGIDLA